MAAARADIHSNAANHEIGRVLDRRARIITKYTTLFRQLVKHV
jgi:hypothetical protein